MCKSQRNVQTNFISALKLHVFVSDLNVEMSTDCGVAADALLLPETNPRESNLKYDFPVILTVLFVFCLALFEKNKPQR